MTFCTEWAQEADEGVKDITAMKRKKFDFIVCQGLSGLCVSFPLAKALDKPLVIVRKGDGIDAPNRGGQIENIHVLLDAKYANKVLTGLFVDDWVSGGNTRNRCGTAIHSLGHKLLYQYLYRGNQMTGGKHGWTEIPDAAIAGFGPVVPFDQVRY